MAKIRIKEHITVRAGDLLPNPDNWRVHPPGQVEALRSVIGEVGHVAESLVVKTRRGLMLVDGHLRASLDPDEQIPVAVLDLTPAEQRKVLATFDVIGEMADTDDEKFRAILERAEATTEDFRKTLVQFEANIDGGTPKARGRKEPDDIPEDVEKRTAPGDLWKCGEHRILCGDTTDAEDTKRLMGRKRGDLVITDPPYAIYGSSSGIGSDMSDDKMVRPFFLSILDACAAHVSEFSHIYVFCDWRSWPSWWEMAKRTKPKLTPKNLLVWDKGGAGLGSSYANTYELVGFLALLPKETVMTSNARRGQRTVNKSNILRYNRVPSADREHNAAKPVELIGDLIGNSSDAGDLVIDWFCGSGSTLIACEQTGRVCYSMEIDPGYCDVAVRRWAAFTGQEPELERRK